MSIQRFPNLTPSRAAALSCLKRFEAEHVLKTTVQSEFSQPMAYGSVVHETLKGVFDPIILLPPAQRNLQGIALKAIYRQNYPDTAMRDTDLEKCIATVVAYIEQSSNTEETIGVEVFDSVTIARGVLHSLRHGG